MKPSDKKGLSGVQVYLVSACLVGLKTRYDCRIKESQDCLRELAGSIWMPVCPEQLGGLPTPRVAADLVGGDGFDVLAGRGRVVNREGVDVTAQFVEGAQQVLTVARQQPVVAIFVKSGSPSCGLTPRIGVMAALLQQAGFALREF